MDSEKMMRRQILDGLEALHRLILKYAEGDLSVKPERDRLEGALQVKFAIWRSLARDRSNSSP